MQQTLLERLSSFTEEELAIQHNGGAIDWAVYSPTGLPKVDGPHMLGHDRLICLRPHVRTPHFPRHSHNLLEIVYMCRGTTHHIMGDGQEVHLKEGGILFLNQGMSHEVFLNTPDALAINLLILPEFFDASFSFDEGESALTRFLFSVLRKSRQPAWLMYNSADHLPIHNLMETLIWSLLEDRADRLALNRATMSLLFRELIASETVQSSTDEDRLLVDRALQYIEAEYSHASLSEFARRESIEVYTISRRIKSATGCTFRELLQTSRLVHAAALLRQTDLSVSDIADAVGYSNLSWFYRAFSLRYESTPAAYRRYHKL